MQWPSPSTAMSITETPSSIPTHILASEKRRNKQKPGRFCSSSYWVPAETPAFSASCLHCWWRLAWSHIRCYAVGVSQRHDNSSPRINKPGFFPLHKVCVHRVCYTAAFDLVLLFPLHMWCKDHGSTPLYKWCCLKPGFQRSALAYVILKNQFWCSSQAQSPSTAKHPVFSTMKWKPWKEGHRGTE